MLIEGTINSNKSEILVDKYVELVDNGVNSNEILVICLNSFKRQNFIEKVKEKITVNALENPNIYTFYGLCYNAVLDNWAAVENEIKHGDAKIIPNLCGLEVSQYILKQSVREIGFKDYASKINLLHQLFRRNSLIVQNKLSDADVNKRSQILKESFREDAKSALNLFKRETLDKRSFDYLRQLAMFPLICKNTDYFSNIKYLIVDDADEITYIIWDFINYLKPQLKDIFIAYDKNGASRCGYLSAYKTSVFKFEELFEQRAITLASTGEIASEAEILFENIKENKKSSLKSLSLDNNLKRLDMIDSVLNKIQELLKSGVKPEQISIISPTIDNALKFPINEALGLLGIGYQIISGSEKLCENQFIKNSMIILKLANKSWGLKVEEFEVRGLLTNTLKIPLKYCYGVLQAYKNNLEITDFDFNDKELNEKYNSLLNTIKHLSENNLPLSKQLFYIYQNNCENLKKEDYEKFAFLLKEVESFEKAFFEDDEILKKEFIIQLENTVISENPSNPTQIDKNSIIISTPQKIIDLEIKSKHQLWLDISNSEWLKQDIGPLYNSWVFNAEWDKDEFTYEDNLRLTKEKTARILRKLMLCASKKIYCYSSFYDSLGNENFGGLLDFLDTQNYKEESFKPFKITPRKDQKPVLDYKEGKMGIMAVPGAGKTTILLALIIKMLESGIKGENIFVLTYMESAARNLKERIKNSYPQNIELPNISTIHGLALRIIKENSNYAKLNLSDNFEICDDNQKQKIIRETLLRLKLDQDNYEHYEKCISIIKLSANRFQLSSKYKEINDFIRFYNGYNKTLRANNLIDYDDMLDLSVKLLEENPDILEYYQDICHFVIEDEAQDSSALQQKLLSLLSSKHDNLIRCGDINQSITSTFTNSDLKDFKNFIEQNHKVEMQSSQRCSKPIYTLANKLIEHTQLTPELKNSFYKIEMIPTESNPATNIEPFSKIFEKEADEKIFILKQIKNILIENPKTSIALLLRKNYQVNNYHKFLSDNGLKTITRTDCLGEKPVFQLLMSILKLVQKPWNNKLVIEVSNIFQKNEIIEIPNSANEFIKELKTPFITSDYETIENANLGQFYWDINYWINNSHLPLDELCIKIGLYYFKTTVEKSNIYLISVFIKRLISSYKKIDTVIEKLEDLSTRANLSGYKFFSEEENEENKENKDLEGKINIMTVHKSKGDEFDVVFIPEINEESYSTAIETTKIKSNTHFIETIKGLGNNYKRKTNDELKTLQIEENLRLLYVGITRTKEKLYLSCSEKYTKRKFSKPCKLFTSLWENNNE